MIFIYFVLNIYENLLGTVITSAREMFSTMHHSQTVGLINVQKTFN